MNWETVFMRLYALCSGPTVTVATVTACAGVWMQSIRPYIQANRSISTALLVFSVECQWRTSLVSATQMMILTVCITAALVANYVACRVTHPLNSQEAGQVCRRIGSENSGLQLLVVALGQEKTGPVELLIWGCMYGVYTVLRAVLVWTDIRLQSNQRSGVNGLITLELVAIGGIIVVTGWVFWQAGALILLQFHYDGLGMMLLLAAMQMNGKTDWTACELRCIALSHCVSFLQWSHFLLAHMKWLGFPLQFLLFYRLTMVLQLLQQDWWRYRGFQQSTGLLLQQCPPLPSSQVAALGDEKCCMCWELLTSGTCSQLPCSHVHHVECLRKLMMSSRNRKCPLCKQVFLQTAHTQQTHEFMRVLAQLTAPRGGMDFAIARVREIVPQASEAVIREELERTRSMQQTIANLVDSN